MEHMPAIRKLIGNLEARNIEAEYAENRTQALARILAAIPPAASVGIGNSQTLKALRVSETLTERGQPVYDKTFSRSPAEARSLKKKALLADWFVSGTNAVSHEGHIVNIDHSGNRVAALLFGPDHVLIVVGVNKLVPTLDDAIARAREQAAPQNARRAGFNPPCVASGTCVDCRSPERVCRSLVIIEGQAIPGRVKVLVIGEKLGY